MANKPVWERKNPKTKHEKRTPTQKAKATRLAEKHGRTNPSLVDNFNAAKASKTSKTSQKS